MINEFDNRPGMNSDRGGDPNTSQRQFTRGFIGLQNHGGADTMQYRNIRVEDLTPGAPTPPTATGLFTVAGDGPHTVEVRTTDAAGNVEERKSFDVRRSVAARRRGTTCRRRCRSPPTSVDPAADDRHARRRTASARCRRAVTRATFNRRGITVPVACTGAMTGSAKLTVSSARPQAAQARAARRSTAEDVKCWGPHTARVTLKPSSAIAKALARKGGPKSVKLTLSVQMRDWGKPATTTKKTITLRR